MMKALLRVVNVVVSMLAVYAAANFALSVKAEAQEKSRQPATSTQSTSVRITAEDIRRTPSGKEYIINLMKPGKIFDLDATANSIEPSQIKIRFGKGEVAFDKWLKERLPVEAYAALKSGHLRLGFTKDFLHPKGGVGTSGGVLFTCTGLRCDCEGDEDCNDMFSSGVCGQIAACWDGHCGCLRL